MKLHDSIHRWAQGTEALAWTGPLHLALLLLLTGAVCMEGRGCAASEADTAIWLGWGVGWGLAAPLVQPSVLSSSSPLTVEI